MGRPVGIVDRDDPKDKTAGFGATEFYARSVVICDPFCLAAKPKSYFNHRKA